MASSSKVPSPQKVMEDLWAGWKSYALLAAVELDLFTQIASGRSTVAELARALGASERGVERLCEAMVEMEYLYRRDGRYALRPLAKTYLVRDSELYMDGLAKVGMQTLLGDWARLKEAVISGKPVGGRVDLEQGGEFFRDLVKVIFPTSYVAAQAAMRALVHGRRPAFKDILDIGAGSAAWSLPFALNYPNVRVCAVDLAPVLEVTRQYVERYGVGERYEYVAGDFHQIDFGTDRYDLVILGHIVHGESVEKAKALLAKSMAALRKKGILLIASYIRDAARRHNVTASLFGLNMLLHTPEGDAYSIRQYREWLKEVGAKAIKTVAVPAPSPVIIASK